MALDDKDRVEIKTLFEGLMKAAGPELAREIGASLDNSLDQKLSAFRAGATTASSDKDRAGGEKGPPPKDKSADAGPDEKTQRELADMRRELRSHAFMQHLPDNVVRERASAAIRLLESEGRLISRGQDHYIRLDRNGIPTEIPLATGLKEWAGSREADMFVKAPQAGAGSTGSTASPVPAGGKVSATEVLSRGLGEFLQ